ncbi:alpha/beta fold hydrolase [Zooshikella harenae]|uniref:Alpha/beta hydrolase n=1 Tax=Zooshikella harenae TaxID=2827238 RepID=A0ABS5ZA62_9GAMM|nr:alpha/beta hydrolase [Zooshikella harenae]MBU2710948.1 alpha/beta hydrolase [Zooshikella harenae]
MPLTIVNTHKIAYNCYGQGTPVLLLHGLGSCGKDWQAQIEVLAAHYYVITPDFRGHGDSAKPPGPYSIRGMAEDIRQLLAQLKIQRCHVVGLSMGGMIALQLAVDHPTLFYSITLINSGPGISSLNWSTKLFIWQRIAIIKLFGMRVHSYLLMKRLFPLPSQDKLREKGTQRWQQNDKAAYLAAFEALVHWSVEPQLERIQCPVLVLAAEHDYTPVAYKQSYIRHFKQGTLAVITDSRHASPLDQPEQVNQHLLHFLSQQQVALTG